jgi:hypothetical protein
MLGAVADDRLVPEVFRLWGASLDGAGNLRALASADAGLALATLQAGSRVALTFTDVTTFESVQVKGSAAGPATPPGPADVALMQRYGEAFGRQLQAVGHPGWLAQRLRPVAVFVLTASIDARYDQTPGSAAGAAAGAGAG